jgi:hypothetical protein
MRRLRASFKIDPTRRGATVRCGRRHADSLRRRLFDGIYLVGIHVIGFYLVGFYLVEFRRCLDRLRRVLLQ